MAGESDLADVKLFDALTELVSRAGAEVMRIRAADLNTRAKTDSTPVTAADEAAEAVLLEGLQHLLPGIPVVSEEAAGKATPTLGPAFICIDPVDGTRELVLGRDEFTINVAIVKDGRPLVGLIGAPARQLLWRGRIGHGAERLRLSPGAPLSQAQERAALHVRKAGSPLVAAVSRSHLEAATQALLDRLPNVQTVSCGSALKFCRVAEGQADIYPRLAPTREWDVAAGDALLGAAGGKVTTPAGEPIRYGQADRNFRIPAFIARGDPAFAIPAAR